LGSKQIQPSSGGISSRNRWNILETEIEILLVSPKPHKPKEVKGERKIIS
jgi:hypothetical protein